MQQETQVRRDRASSVSDLSGYGDLSDFDPQANQRHKEQDEQAAIDLIMGGEDFLIGDGTLQFNLREQDRDLMPITSPVSPEVKTQTSRAQIDEDFEPIENGYPDPGDEVARQAVNDALARLESIVEVEPRSDAIEQDVQSDELSAEAADEILGGVGLASDLESEAPTPFPLMKLPGSHEQNSPPATAAIHMLRVLEDAQVEDDAGDAADLARALPASGIFDRLEQAQKIGKRDDSSEVAATLAPSLESKTDEFAPFELTQLDQEEEPFDTAHAELPSYTRRTTEVKTAPTSAIDDDLDAFLPPSDEAPRAQAQATELVSAALPAYSQPREERLEIEIDPFEEHLAAQRKEEPPVDEAHEHEEESYQPEPQGASTPAASAKKTFLQQYGMGIVGAVIVACMIGWKQYSKQQAAEKESAAPVEEVADTPSIERDFQRTPISKVLGPMDLAPVVEQLPASATPVQSQATPIAATAAGAESKIETTIPPTVDQDIVAKLADLTERMSSLESERDNLRNENATLKRKMTPAPKPKNSARAKRVEEKAPAAVIAPARTPVKNIQYLGTFRDGDRLVAELLVNGNLSRVKRGDTLLDSRRVDAVGDMSVTIDDVVYSP